MNQLSFTNAIVAIALNKHNGIAAFDPVTLYLAASKCAEEVVPLAIPAQLHAPRPPGLAELATLSVRKDAFGIVEVDAVIDTGHLVWDVDADPTESTFKDYTGKTIKAIQLAKITVAKTPSCTVVKIPMQLPSGALVSAWFAEIQQEQSNLEGLALMRQAQSAMQAYAAAVDKYHADVHVPELKITYESAISSSVQCAEQVDVRQLFKAELDVSGARVVAKTTMVVAAAFIPSPESPKEVRLGETGPVLWWLTDAHSHPEALPFAVFYTEAAAWIAPSSVKDSAYC